MSDIETDVRRFDASYPPSLFPPVVVPPAPTLTTLTPNTSVVGVPVVVTITGTGFTVASVVKADGAVLPSTFVSATSITVSGTPIVDGDSAITVTDAGGVSNALTYTVTLVADPEPVPDPEPAQADVSQITTNGGNGANGGNGGAKRKKAGDA